MIVFVHCLNTDFNKNPTKRVRIFIQKVKHSIHDKKIPSFRKYYVFSQYEYYLFLPHTYDLESSFNQ